MSGPKDDNVTAMPRSSPARARAAWQAWLSALADDAEAALAAALTYDALGGPERDAWLDALEEDAAEILVPRESLFAPLLLVEEDETRRLRISMACGDMPIRAPARAWWGRREDGLHVCIVVAPLWLRFVETLRCGYSPETGVSFAEHDPLRRDDDVEHAELRGAQLERAELADVVEGLAHAILSDRRAGREAPQAVAAFAHLFSPEREAVVEWCP